MNPNSSSKTTKPKKNVCQACLMQMEAHSQTQLTECIRQNFNEIIENICGRRKESR